VAFQRGRPDLTIDVVEIDPVVTDLARRYFAYGRRSYPNIHVHHEDARVFLRGAAGRYDLIYLDVFDHLLTVPWTMVTREALSDMSARLGPGGLFIANVLSPHAGPGSAFAERFLSTTWEVFEEVTVYLTRPEADSTAIQNLIVIASDDPAALPSIPWPRAAVGPSGRALSDRWAPVEYLQASYFLQGVRWR
jgi:spermidine synthase